MHLRASGVQVVEHAAQLSLLLPIYLQHYTLHYPSPYTSPAILHLTLHLTLYLTSPHITPHLTLQYSSHDTPPHTSPYTPPHLTLYTCIRYWGTGACGTAPSSPPDTPALGYGAQGCCFRVWGHLAVHEGKEREQESCLKASVHQVVSQKSISQIRQLILYTLSGTDLH